MERLREAEAALPRRATHGLGSTEVGDDLRRMRDAVREYVGGEDSAVGITPLSQAAAAPAAADISLDWSVGSSEGDQGEVSLPSAR